MKSLIFVISILLTPVLWAQGDLVFQRQDVYAETSWQIGPRVYEESILKIQWRKAMDHTPIEPPGLFKVELAMPEMDHGSVPTQIQRILDSRGQPLVGVYEISNIYFSMGGDWDVNLSLLDSDGNEEIQTLKVSLPKEDVGHHSAEFKKGKG